MKYYIIAGEVSGDLHASFLMKELKRIDDNAEFRVWGGDNMLKEGGVIVKHIRELNFMGFIEVVANLKTILSNFKLCKRDIINYNPDAVIMVDYPGFNLRIAKFCHSKSLKTMYYISPKVWAWKKGRIKTMKRVIDNLFVIFPFEKEFFAKHNFEVEYYGNPLLDEIQEYKKLQNKEAFLRENNLEAKPIIALLPGSRVQEIKAMLPLQVSLSEKYTDFEFVVAGLTSHKKEFYEELIGNHEVKIIYDNTYSLLNVSYAGVICSGTATLETALFNLPQVVCYKGSPISFAIGKFLVNLDYISLVNLILNKGAVMELLQGGFNEENLDKEFRKIVYDANYRIEMEMNYSNLRTLLGNSGASKNVANRIYDIVTNNV